ncbi:DUF1329 domain-containing protein [Spectribacter hydrogenooxidans]|uniref:DUF1329 domain-containing protein n=1 Tax=Spectribacter hydrogenoxidans TaxID=3075608 RepID=A0ABU3C3U2_9GAMM|nr:DUF1329 domain-containing protein [Salinisphaera sp. W335]MDT0636004.1 DUF1329 domain-containing protein [Salinisphaera sp. W335]
MHIRKYDFDYGRRMLMEKAAKGIGSAGVLTSLWPMITKADTPDIKMAYPEELTSIEAHTKGKIKPGDVITADNLEHVEHLLDPIEVIEIREDGRRIKIQETTTDMTDLFEDPFLEATLRNQGRAMVDSDGNVWDQKKGNPLRGGLPFVEPDDGYQAQANINLSWGRHNYQQYGVRDWDLGPDGELQYQYDFVWAELQVNARPDDTSWNGETDMLRYQSVFFTAPNEQSGTSFLNTWPYDQRQFPGLIGYLPAFKRVREYPTNQRFEPLVPGITVFLSNAWAAGDPLATWGNHKIVERKPMLGAARGAWAKDDPNWEPGVHGGPQGKTYWDSVRELVPETIVVDLEPTGYPRSPVGKRRTWFDARNFTHVLSVDYDRKGKVWKNWDAGYAKYEGMKTPEGHTPWSWAYVTSHDIQSGRMSRFHQAKEVTGGYKSEWGTDGDTAYDKYLTTQAMRRLGA